MSEDTDERMERAQRIRQMREGQRQDAADDGSEDSGSSTDDSSASSDTDTGEPDTQPDSGEDAATGPEEGTPSDSDDDAGSGPEAVRRDDFGASDSENQSAETADDAADPEPATDSTGAAPSGTDVTPETGPNSDAASDGGASPSDGLDDEATAVAERAAQAAATVTGTVSGGATDDGPPSAQATAAASSTDESGDSPGTTATAAPIQGPTGVELPDEDSIQAAIADEVVDADADETSEPATGRGVTAQDAAKNEETVRVLEFTLGDEHYCLDIAHVEEIVKREAITRVPNTPDYVEGVVDLRGQITTILDPKLLLDIDQEGSESLLVVFAPEEFEDQGAIGWAVDEVRQVAPIAKSEVSSAPVDADYIEGVIDRDDEEDFVIWTNPEVAIRMATGEAESEN